MSQYSKTMKAIYIDNYVWGKHYESIRLCEADKVDDMIREIDRRNSEIVCIKPLEIRIDDIYKNENTARTVKRFLDNLDNEQDYVDRKELAHRLYEQTSKMLTKYENEIENGICDGIGEDDLYTMLLKIHRNWEAITR